MDHGIMDHGRPWIPERGPSRGQVLRTFVRDGKLRRLPAKWRKRRIVLEHVVTSFEPGVRYAEPAVDAILRTWYPDYCALRRYLVDEDLLARSRGIYWRIGGVPALLIGD